MKDDPVARTVIMNYCIDDYDDDTDSETDSETIPKSIVTKLTHPMKLIFMFLCKLVEDVAHEPNFRTIALAALVIQRREKLELIPSQMELITSPFIEMLIEAGVTDKDHQKCVLKEFVRWKEDQDGSSSSESGDDK